MAKSTSRQQYIDQYAEYAMEQMRRYGIPASVTLAQGIIESANGKSTLAETGNNHFGVKGTFNGAYVVANDDKPNEKFKKYDNVGQSYEDHSKVLMASRYQKYVSSLSPGGQQFTKVRPNGDGTDETGGATVRRRLQPVVCRLSRQPINVKHLAETDWVRFGARAVQHARQP